MQVEAEVLGGYPRSRRLRRIMRRVEEVGNESLTLLWEVLKEDSLMVIGAQLGAGLTNVVDGMLDWHDLFRPFVEAWRGVYVDGLLRWFDNNFFYRIPVFVEPPDPQRLVLAPRVAWVKGLIEGLAQVKVVLPGPYTLVGLSRNNTGLEELELAKIVARILSREVEEAVRTGAAVVQLDEPLIGDVDASPEKLEDYTPLINDILEKAKQMGASTRLSIPYSVPAKQVYEKLLNIKADYIVIDFADSPKKALELVSEKGTADFSLGLGVIQARDIYVDDYNKVSSIVLETAKALKDKDKILITTSAWLDLIPLNYAIRKTWILGEYARRLQEVLA
ncbi:MAG: methylcobalamin--homocysteine methyltransferase [Pyrodictiaceae archaeon]